MYSPEGVANPRTPNVGPTFLRSGRGDKVRLAVKTEWEVVAGERMRLECCRTREMMRALAIAVFREGIMRVKEELSSVRCTSHTIASQVIELDRL